MNVLLISRCNKNALTETRRILDQFAERKGDRAWQTPITWDGLTTLRKLLRKTARKNTAVACHWIRGKDHSELMWIVGDSSRFNAEGSVPTNTTGRNILRQQDENDWHTAEDIKLLAALAALLHDVGKACKAFQQRLLGKGPQGANLYRHEWISLRLFQSFVGKDDDAGWLSRLAGADSLQHDWLDNLVKDGMDNTAPYPFRSLPPLAQAIGWLIITHHRLPGRPTLEGLRAQELELPLTDIDSQWNQRTDHSDPEEIAPYWIFDAPLPVATKRWRTQAAKYAQRLQQRLERSPDGWLSNAYVMHLARLSLMLSDHHYSSLSAPNQRVKGEADYPLYANTNRKTGELCQRLDEHLLGVAKVSRSVSHHLPTLNENLPRLARHKGFRKRSQHARFRWQDHAFDLAEGLRACAARQGFFGINMASTGCGKTLANGRILYALANPQQGARFSVALGLRTLTLQTGQAYRERLHLGDDELAVRVGGSASRQLYEFYEAQAEASGSASSQSLVPEDSHVVFEGNFSEHPVLKTTCHDDRIKALISAPVLVCTVDHLIPATESERGGHQIAPMLRLLSSDLVLDEIDDFDINDLPALTRLVYWTGLLGSRVLLSSATIPPSLAEGLFRAYKAGREQFQRNRGEPGTAVNICCAWFDEHDRKHDDCPDEASYARAHQRFVEKRAQKLARDDVRRRAKLASLSTLTGQTQLLRYGFAKDLMQQAMVFHQAHHSVDPYSHKRVSFGLARMANIEPMVEVAKAIYAMGAETGTLIHLCVYHSQYPLLLRSAIEQQLDSALNRKDSNAVFELPEIRRQIDGHTEQDQLFIVLASPVAEVGRDHDYDWAIVEPSSMRSLIQLAGRVRRHRPEVYETPNIALLHTNLRALEHKGKPAFCRPGFESADFLLSSHDLEQLLLPEERNVIDARPRILPRSELNAKTSLVDLEHARLQAQMLGQQIPQVSAGGNRRRRRAEPVQPLSAASCYLHSGAMLTSILQRRQPFRESHAIQDDLVLLPDEDGVNVQLHKVEFSREHRTDLYIPVDHLLHQVQLACAEGVVTWGAADYQVALEALAEKMELPLDVCAKRFGTLSLDQKDNGWEFHPALGFTVRR
ncbi:type I-F CRISPR-associated helicase Cas3f [Oceanimonas sp. CAM02]|uniref:type I-F CRISPR-associated helicase Cas3f n=1 Tax=Oceanimonas sp. CAM02 TaxID=3080336 RepID=UPI002935A1C9|nr:type I-F CRISPR-associated helicase Cas3f [Oceanimonas sp. CAM02]MDV2857827.1 type I-F CRISPR-associated helicase Cas3f [Oceanimonas sp. CAM02]